MGIETFATLAPVSSLINKEYTGPDGLEIVEFKVSELRVLLY